MINLIIGKKGSGKTKMLIDLVNEAVNTSRGNVVCIEKGDALTYSLSHQARLVDAENYGISGYGELYSLICGIAAGNHDVTHIFGDATLKLGGSVEGLTEFFNRVSAVAEDSNINFVFTISCDEAEIPKEVFEVAKKCN